MKIKELLKINLDEEINTVVDLDTNPSEAALKEGLDNFVLTQSLGKHLYDFLQEYNAGNMESGSWLSGFYGSGKSYFAQIIGLLLQNRNILGTPMRDRFLSKIAGLPNEDLLCTELGALNRFNNIVVSFDSSKHNNVNGLPYMIFSSFLRKLGMPDTWHGIIEYDIFIEGNHQQFLDAVKDITGKEWSEIIKSNIEMTKAFKPALLQMGYTSEQYVEMKALAESTKKEYDASRLQQDLARYIGLMPDTRIVFFIDEVSEAITQKKIRLDDLEGVAEALAALGRKVWTIAIAQQRLDDVIKAENVQANSLTKVRDRFRFKIAIEADEVDTIIRHRLLDKTDQACTILRDYFSENNGVITDVTNIGVASLKKTDNVNTYIDYYPFFMHQFKLLQYFLFGSGNLTQTRVGNRGMIISAFDVLKKEVKNETSDHYHVNATQLCNQADDRVEEALANRYRQAEQTLAYESYDYVSGKKLLQTINFLTKSEVRTTIENISKSYLNRPENFHDIQAEVKDALNKLKGEKIVNVTGEQYRITNEAEQRLLDDMARFDVQSWEIIQDINNVLKKRDIVKWASLLNIGSMNVRFKVATADGEIYANADENNLAVILCDLLATPGCDDTPYVDGIRHDTADRKGRLTLIPTIKYRTEIRELATELRRLKYISDRTNLTDEEKTIVRSLCSELDAKRDRFNELVESSYLNGLAVYCYNKFVLDPGSCRNTLAEEQTKMFENIFTKRLSAELPDSLAQGVFTAQVGKLHTYFGTSPDFKFFDTAGIFIGSGLSVVTEILAACSTFTSGKDLETKLVGPPTGYSLGTIMVTLAALFRGDKIIVKYSGDEYTSCRQSGATEAFRTARNFSKASFKTVSQSLSYNEKRDIVDILKEDCNYTKITHEQISYQLNDFEIVDAIRSLAKAMISKVNDKIEFDDDLRKMFSKSLSAKSVLQQYQAQVTEANMLRTAKNFLIESNTDEFIKAVERISNDISFIDEKMRIIREMKTYIEEVKDQFEKAQGSDAKIKVAYDDFYMRHDNDIVTHYPKLVKDAQDITDAYIATYKATATKVKAEYAQISAKADDLRSALSSYPREWNANIWTMLQRIEAKCQQYVDISDTFDKYAVKSLRSKLDLREVTVALDNAPALTNELIALKAQIRSTDPGSTPPPPKVHKLKSKLPQGDISVEQYRRWLTQQLTFVSTLNDKDKINLSE